MRKGVRPHPTLNALRTFEVAGRRQSFTAAALELNVTQAAVSRQIQQLEREIGRALFKRVYRGVVLTAAGQALLRRLTQAFTEIHDAVTATCQERPYRLCITAEPEFSAYWLAPRLQRLLQECSDIDLHIHPTFGMNGLGFEADLSVRYLRVQQRSICKNMEHLIDVIGFPVASPSLLSRRSPVTTPAEVSRLPLLHEDDGARWRQWLSAAGVHDVVFRRQTQLRDHSALLRAAVDGQGVIIANSLVASDDLAAGRLVKLTSVEVLLGAYWLMHNANSRRSWAEQRLGRWLRENLTPDRASMRLGTFHHNEDHMAAPA